MAPIELEYLPSAQLTHTAAESAATDVEYLPAAHCVQAPEPFKDLNVPAMHAVQLPFEPVNATLQMQWARFELPLKAELFGGHGIHDALEVAATAAEYVSGGHSTQIASPWTNCQYLPAAHALHVSPTLLKPLLHVQFMILVLFLGAALLSGHCVQVVLIAAEYVLNPQGEHVPDPMPAFDFPAAHASHSALPPPTL